MFTPQEVSSKTFPKASFGGYNMVAVDEFLDSLTEDYTAMYKDNATLKAKLKVLAEKVEEYRATEDAMRSTLLTAQKMAAQMVQQAEEEKQQILTQTQEEAAKQKAVLETEIQQTEQKLAMAKKSLVEFIAHSQELCANQAAFLQSLPEIDVSSVSEEDPMTANTVRLIEQDIMKDYVQPAAEAPAAEAPAAEEPTTEDTNSDTAQETASAEAEKSAADETPAADKADAPQAVAEKKAIADFNLDDLKFGRNYSNEH